MRNYYFFKSTTYRNEQGETRRCLRALPGQHMRNNDTGSPAVSTEYHVQCDAATLNMVCRLPLGTIFGCYEEGNTFNRSTLTVYHRNDNAFYRPAKIWALRIPGENGAITGVEGNDGHPNRLAVYAAYCDFVTPRQEVATAQETTTPQETAAAAQEPASTTEPQQESLAAIRGNAELVGSIRDTLRTSNPRDVKVSTVSYLLDLLARGAAHFTFMKQNGTQRSAIGTRNADMIRELTQDEMMSPENQRDRALDGEHISYFDIEKGAWRCFCTRDLLTTSAALTRTSDTGFQSLRSLLGSTASEV